MTDRGTLAADVAEELERPVFVLGCAWRCGGTLVQRVLSSGPELFVWGENVGMSTLLQTIERRLATYEDRSAREWRDFQTRGTSAWIACLNPPFPDGVREATRAFYRAYFEARTRALGRRRWGFKEVRHGAETAAFLADVFPACRVVFVLRSPVDVVASMATRSWYAAAGGAVGVLRTWRANTASLLDWSDPRLLTVRYETLIADPAAEVARVARHLDLDPSTLDLTLFARPERGFQAAPALGIEERRALAERELVRIAARAGYEVADDPRLRLIASTRTSLYLYARRVYLRTRRTLTRDPRARPQG
ncbi:MAG: sulfotransferase [Deltaproteobacteria bacterium]|nr:sulfotransferase [Deltaproteobacteria bacterium]